MLRLGACYHPECFTPDEIKDHIKLMVKARVKLVRMGEFSWSRFEPEQGRFKFDWMDDVIAQLHERKIGVILCNPFAAPPMWVHTKHPNIRHVSHLGIPQPKGTRNSCCRNAAEFQILADAMLQELARHYGKNDAIACWQLDSNQFDLGYHPRQVCLCEHCEKAFRQWLLKRYGDTDAVNAAWGGAIGGTEYRQWNEIPAPRVRYFSQSNPGLVLDYARFQSDSRIEFIKRQRQILAGNKPEQVVTCEISGDLDGLNFRGLSDTLNFMSCGTASVDVQSPFEHSFAFENTRSVSGSFWVVRQRLEQCGVGGVDGFDEGPPEPGELRRTIWQSVANGADAVCLYPWHAFRYGVEQDAVAVIDHDGLPRRRYKEVARTGEEFEKISPLIEGTTAEAKVGMLADSDTASMHACLDYYRAVKRTGHVCDIGGRRMKLTRYRVVLAPSLALVDEDLAEALEKYVKAGGTLVLAMGAGTHTMNNARSHSTPPGLLMPIVGATVDEVVGLRGGQTNTVNFARGSLIAQQCKVEDWLEVLDCPSANVLAEYVEGRLKGKPAIVHRTLEKGEVFYIGCKLPQETLEKLIADIVPSFPIKDIPDGVEVTQRKGENSRLVFIINHSGERRTIKLPGKFPDVLSGETVGPEVTVSANGILILKGSS